MPSTVLIVDDDGATVEVLAEILEDEGYEVRTARDGIAALKRVEEERPDLMLLDLYMPLLDGFGVVQALRGSPRTAGLPVIVMTAHTSIPEWPSELGVEICIIKPFRLDEVLQCVARCLAPVK